MAQSLAKAFLHIVFSTKERKRFITPKIENRLLTEFTNPETVIEAGYRAGKEKVPEILRRLRALQILDEDNYYFTPMSIDFRGLQMLSADSVRAWMTNREGIKTDLRGVQADLFRFYEKGFFSDIRAIIVRKDEGHKITFVLRENPVIQNIVFQHIC